MPTFDDFLFWHGLYLEVRELEEFTDLNLQVEQLKTKVQLSRKFSDEDEYAFYSIVTTNYQKINKKIGDFLNNRINKRGTRGQTFADEQNKIEHLLIDNELNNQDIEKYIEIYDDLYDISNVVIDKIKAERFNIFFTVLGFIIGFLLGLLGSLLLKLWGFC